jgi:Asp/Glu/hydantoin racemase
MAFIGVAHATTLAIDPIRQAFADYWPEAGLEDFSDLDLPAALAAAGGETPEIRERLGKLADRAADSGVDAILFTCSAFGRSIEEVQNRLPMPVLKPNEAMFHEALARGGKVGMVATFAPSIPSMTAEYEALARQVGADPELRTICAEKAMEAALAGDSWLHARIITDAALRLSGCDVIMLAQFSMVEAAEPVEEATGIRPLTSPASAVRMLKTLVGEDTRLAANAI